MAYYDLVWYCNAGNQSTTGYYAVALRPQNAAVTAGQLVRQFTAPAVGSERVFVCIIAGTTANTTDATWVLTRGAKTTDGTATWMECTGQAGLNGDLTNTATWAQVKAVTPAALGQIIKRSNNASYQICTTAGAMSASEPAMSDTAGVTTTDTTVVWTSLGPVGNFTSGQAPFARLATVFSLSAVAGNTVYVGDNHAESQATAITIAPAASQTTVGKIICHNHSGSYPPTAANLATTATISTTGSAAVTFQPAASGIVYIYGLTFVAGVGQSTAANVVLSISTGFSFFDACVFKLATTASSALISLNTNIGNASIMTWNNCQVSFSTASQYINPYGTDFVWQNTAPVLATGSTVTTNLFGQFSTNFKSNILLEGLDLSSWTSVFLPTGANLSLGNWIVKDCKLNASATFPNPANTGQVIQTVRADGGATAYKSARYTLEGTETTETSITRVGGAADPTGQAQSRKIVTTANSQWLRPFKAEPYAMWNPVTGANVTVTVCGTVNSGALPNNDDIWMDVEYLGSSSFPQGTIVNTTKANLLAANAAGASDGSSWNNANPTSVGFDPTSISNVTLTNSNLTATHSNTSIGGAQGIGTQSSGKWYFEVTQATTGHGIGDIIAALGPVPPNYGTLGTSATVTRVAGLITVNSVGGASLGAFAIGDVCGVAVDFNVGLIWFRRNAGNWNNSGTANPATGVGGIAFNLPVTLAATVAFGGSGTAAGDAYTVNFGATSYANAAPAGFANWVSWSPFKLTTTLSSPQPGMAGYIHVRPRVAKPSSTFYLDPQITLGIGGTVFTPKTIDGTAGGQFSVTINGTVTLSTTLPNDVVVLVYFHEASGTSTISSVTSPHLTWTKRSSYAATLGTWPSDVEIWWAPSTAVLTGEVITVTVSPNADDAAYHVFGVNGCANILAPWDTNGSLATAQAVVNSGTSATVSGVTTVSTVPMVIGCTGSIATSGIVQPIGTTKIRADQNNGGGIRGAYFTSFYENYSVAVAGASYTTTFGSSANWAMVIDALA